MKKFRILGIIAIIAILANFIGGLDEDWKDFKKGFEEGQSGATEMYESGHHMITRVKLNVKPLSGTTVDSLNNNRVDSPLPYTVTEIETYAKPSAWYILVIGLAIPGLFFFLIGFYSLIRLLISISRRKVFTPANVLRLRWFAYTSASLKILTAIGEWNFPALIGLCEVENDTVMRDLTLYSPLKEAGYRYVMTHCSDLRGINVALLYQRDRFKLLSYSALSVGNFKGHRPTRDILHVSGLLLTGDTLDIMVAHLPSRSGGVRQSEPYRLYAAQKLKDAADSLINVRPSAKLIIMGDFNDYPTDKSVVQVLQALSPEVSTHHDRLYHLLARKAKDRNFGSYKYQGEWGLLDHLIVSGTLLDISGTLFTEEKKANVARLPFLLTKDEKYGGMQPFRTYVGMKYQEGYSDHLPVYVDFETNQSEY